MEIGVTGEHGPLVPEHVAGDDKVEYDCVMILHLHLTETPVSVMLSYWLSVTQGLVPEAEVEETEPEADLALLMKPNMLTYVYSLMIMRTYTLWNFFQYITNL